MYPSSPKLPSHPGCHVTLSRVPCAAQGDLVGHHFKYSSVCMSTPHKFLTVPSPASFPSPGFQVHVLSLPAGNQPVALSLGWVFLRSDGTCSLSRWGWGLPLCKPMWICVVTRGVRAVLKPGAPSVPGAAIGGAGVLRVLPPGPKQPRRFLFCLVYRLASVCAVLEDRVLCLRGLA